MATSHQNHSQNDVVNGANGFNGGNGRNGGDGLPQPQPGQEVAEPVPSLEWLCFRVLFLCCDLLQGLVLYISRELQLPDNQTMDAIYGHLNDADNSTAWATAAACMPQPQKWYFFVPVRLIQMITSTGATLIERYLDRRVPKHQNLANWLRDISAAFIGHEEEAHRLLGSDVDPELPFSYTDVGPVLSSTSSGSSLIIDEEHQSKEVEDERPATAAEAAGGAATSTEQPQPEPQPQPQPETQPQLPAAAPAECPVSAQEAEQAGMGAPCTPLAQPASSQDFLAAHGLSDPTPGPIRTARSPAKGARFLNLFGSKKA